MRYYAIHARMPGWHKRVNDLGNRSTDSSRSGRARTMRRNRRAERAFKYDR